MKPILAPWPEPTSRQTVQQAAVFVIALMAPFVSPSPASAQASGEGLVRQPDRVREVRIRLDELPPPATITDTMRPARLGPADLPAPLSLRAQLALEQSLRSNVLEIIALHRPAPPFRATDLVYRGHALWLQPTAASEVQLITTLDWLEGAHALFAVVPDGQEASAQASGRRSSARRTSHGRALDTLVAGRALASLPEDLRARLVPIETWRANRHYNLTVLRSRLPVQEGQGDAPTLTVPAKPLELSEHAPEAAAELFGFSPQLSPSVAACQIAEGAPSQEALSFYIATTFPGILGAPIVDARGRIRAINAFRDPAQPELTRAVPAKSLASYLTWANGVP